MRLIKRVFMTTILNTPWSLRDPSSARDPWHARKIELECGPMLNVMVALPNIGGALCSVPQRLADANYFDCRAVTLPRSESR